MSNRNRNVRQSDTNELSATIAEQTAAFLKAGGKIEQVEQRNSGRSASDKIPTPAK
jgi:hypothetical protein